MEAALRGAVAFCGFLVASMVATNTPTSASQPAPQVFENRSDYGPVSACFYGYALSAESNEAIVLSHDEAGAPRMLRLLQARHSGLILGLEEPSTSHKRTRRRAITLASGITAEEVRVDAWEGWREGIPGEAVWSVEEAYRYYVLPAIGEGSPIIVTAHIFTGRNRGRRLLDQIALAEDVSCDPLVTGSRSDAHVWMPDVIEGPRRICGKGLEITLREGEQFRQSWPSSIGGYRDWLVSSPEGTFRIAGGGQRVRGARYGSLRSVGFVIEKIQSGSFYFRPPRDGGWRSPPFISVDHFDAPDVSDQRVDALLDRISLASPNERDCFTN